MVLLLLFLMIRRPPRSTRTDTLFPYTTRFRSIVILEQGGVLAQHDTPANILGSPASDFVADFVGADRALKRLKVTEIAREDLRQPPVLPIGLPLDEARRRMEADALSSAARRVGKACVSTCRSRWSPEHYKK